MSEFEKKQQRDIIKEFMHFVEVDKGSCDDYPVHIDDDLIDEYLNTK